MAAKGAIDNEPGRRARSCRPQSIGYGSGKTGAQCTTKEEPVITSILVLLLAAQAAAIPKPATDAPADPPADKVEIVLYSDFQCPFSATLAPAIRQIETKGIDG